MVTLLQLNRASAALTVYKPGSEDAIGTDVTDLIVDLLHLATALASTDTAERIVTRALSHYAAERLS